MLADKQFLRLLWLPHGKLGEEELGAGNVNGEQGCRVQLGGLRTIQLRTMVWVVGYCSAVAMLKCLAGFE